MRYRPSIDALPIWPARETDQLALRLGERATAAGLSRGALALFRVLLLFDLPIEGYRKGLVWPTRATLIAEIGGCSRESLGRWIAELERVEWIRADRQRGRGRRVAWQIGYDRLGVAPRGEEVAEATESRQVATGGGAGQMIGRPTSRCPVTDHLHDEGERGTGKTDLLPRRDRRPPEVAASDSVSQAGSPPADRHGERDDWADLLAALPPGDLDIHPGGLDGLTAAEWSDPDSIAEPGLRARARAYRNAAGRLLGRLPLDRWAEAVRRLLERLGGMGEEARRSAGMFGLADVAGEVRADLDAEDERVRDEMAADAMMVRKAVADDARRRRKAVVAAMTAAAEAAGCWLDAIEWQAVGRVDLLPAPGMPRLGRAGAEQERGALLALLDLPDLDEDHRAAVAARLLEVERLLAAELVEVSR